MKRNKLKFGKKHKRFNLSNINSSTIFAIEIVIVIILAFFLVFCFGMRVNMIDNSMAGTVEEDEVVLTNRVSYLMSSPKPGDVIVYTLDGSDHYYIKRVVAGPGDDIVIDNGVLYVNGDMFDDYDTEIISNPGVVDTVTTIGEGEFFVLGDNRNSSEDSRYANVGNIKEENVVGKAWFIAKPFKSMGRIR